MLWRYPMPLQRLRYPGLLSRASGLIMARGDHGVASAGVRVQFDDPGRVTDSRNLILPRTRGLYAGPGSGQNLKVVPFGRNVSNAGDMI
eukprot:1031169-Rhodomonas_salina.1